MDNCADCNESMSENTKEEIKVTVDNNAILNTNVRYCLQLKMSFGSKMASCLVRAMRKDKWPELLMLVYVLNACLELDREAYKIDSDVKGQDMYPLKRRCVF